MRRILLTLLLALPGRAHADALGQLCAAANASQCPKIVAPSPYTPIREPREPREPRAPSCDESCRRRAAEDRKYALEHIVEPGYLPPAIDQVAHRTEKSYRAAVNADKDLDAVLFAGVLVVGAPLEAPLWLVGLFGAAILISLPPMHLERNVPAIWDSIASFAQSKERAYGAVNPAATPPDILHGETGDPGEPPDDEEPDDEDPGKRMKLSEKRLEHIKDEHWSDSTVPDKGKFKPGLTEKDLFRMLKEAEKKGTWRPNTRNRPGRIVEYKFPENIGVNDKGVATNRLRIALDAAGWLFTAFPY